MSEWIMILAVYIGVLENRQVEIESFKFETQELCEKAKSELSKDLDGWQIEIVAKCVQVK